jgi:ribosomal protein L16 Arg81 hydroxylase
MKEFFERYKYKSKLLDDFNLSEFYTSNFEQKPFFLKGSKAIEELKNNFNIYEFEKLLWYAHKIDFKKIQISDNSEKLNITQIQNNDILKLANLYLKKNYCIVINFAEEFSPELAILTREFGEIFNCTAYCSVFLNPPNSNCFNAHYDGIDVFALQIEGEKLWQVGQPKIELPTKNQTYTLKDDSELDEQYLLNTGDFLYIPRGYIHNVLSTDNYSLHISIGLNSNRRIEVYKEVLKSLETTNRYLRETPKGVLKKGYEFIKDEFKSLDILSELYDPYNIRQSVSRINSQKYSQLKLLPNKHLQNAIYDIPITLNTEVIVLYGMPIEITLIQNEKIVMVFPSGLNSIDEWIYSCLTLPLTAISSVEFVRDSQTAFKISEIPGLLSDDSKITLIKELYTLGLLQINNPE